MAGRLQGKVALISGNAVGMGRAAAQVFAAEGARVFAAKGGVLSFTRVRQLAPSRRTGEPEDVARVAAFLASDDAGYVNGAKVVVDGGVSAIAG